MKTLEDIFTKEFKQSVSNVGYKDIYKIPLPPECSAWNISGSDLFVVKDIPDEEFPYSKLNSKIVKRLPQGSAVRRRVIDKATRGFKTGDDGGFVYEDYKVPSGSIAVVSYENIDVPYKGYKVAATSGYGYVDFVNTQSGRQYIYVLPKSVLYGLNQTALALSVTNMKNYSGSGYTTWDNGVIFLHVIPYNPRSKYVGSKILATKCSLDYSREVRAILSFWQKVGVIPDLRLCVLGDGSNLALKKTTVGYPEYIQVQPLALGDKEMYGSGEEVTDGEAGSGG